MNAREAELAGFILVAVEQDGHPRRAGGAESPCNQAGSRFRRGILYPQLEEDGRFRARRSVDGGSDPLDASQPTLVGAGEGVVGN